MMSDKPTIEEILTEQCGGEPEDYSTDDVEVVPLSEAEVVEGLEEDDLSEGLDEVDFEEATEVQ